MEGLWGFVIIAGPALLLALIVFAWLRNRQTRNNIGQAEAGAHRLQERIQREDERRGND